MSSFSSNSDPDIVAALRAQAQPHSSPSIAAPSHAAPRRPRWVWWLVGALVALPLFACLISVGTIAVLSMLGQRVEQTFHEVEAALASPALGAVDDSLEARQRWATAVLPSALQFQMAMETTSDLLDHPRWLDRTWIADLRAEQRRMEQAYRAAHAVRPVPPSVLVAHTTSLEAMDTCARSTDLAINAIEAFDDNRIRDAMPLLDQCMAKIEEASRLLNAVPR